MKLNANYLKLNKRYKWVYLKFIEIILLDN